MSNLALIGSLIAYGAAIAICLASRSAPAGNALIALLVAPFVLPLVVALMAPTVFFVGTVTGTPLVSFMYGLSAMRRSWRGIVVGILFMSALVAIVVALQ